MNLKFKIDFKSSKMAKFISGMEEFPKSRTTYHSNEERNSRFVAKIWRIRIIFLFATYGPAAMYPILYAIIGTPSPDQWKLALPMKYTVEFLAFIIMISFWIFIRSTVFVKNFLLSKSYVFVERMSISFITNFLIDSIKN